MEEGDEEGGEPGGVGCVACCLWAAWSVSHMSRKFQLLTMKDFGI